MKTSGQRLLVARFLFLIIKNKYMKIFVAHSSNFDFKQELYNPLRESALNTQHDIFLPQENGREVVTKETIKDSDVVVAEVSYASTGQGIELGWADVLGIPIICIYKEGSKVSGSIQLVTKELVAYKDKEEMINRLSEALDDLG